MCLCANATCFTPTADPRCRQITGRLCRTPLRGGLPHPSPRPLLGDSLNSRQRQRWELREEMDAAHVSCGVPLGCPAWASWTPALRATLGLCAGGWGPRTPPWLAAPGAPHFVVQATQGHGAPGAAWFGGAPRQTRCAGTGPHRLQFSGLIYVFHNILPRNRGIGAPRCNKAAFPRQRPRPGPRARPVTRPRDPRRPTYWRTGWRSRTCWWRSRCRTAAWASGRCCGCPRAARSRSTPSAGCRPPRGRPTPSGCRGPPRCRTRWSAGCGERAQRVERPARSARTRPPHRRGPRRRCGLGPATAPGLPAPELTAPELWAHRTWAHRTWAHPTWALRTWAHRTWAFHTRVHRTWAHRVWAHRTWAHRIGSLVQTGTDRTLRLASCVMGTETTGLYAQLLRMGQFPLRPSALFITQSFLGHTNQTEFDITFS